MALDSFTNRYRTSLDGPILQETGSCSIRITSKSGENFSGLISFTKFHYAWVKGQAPDQVFKVFTMSLTDHPFTTKIMTDGTAYAGVPGFYLAGAEGCDLAVYFGVHGYQLPTNFSTEKGGRVQIDHGLSRDPTSMLMLDGGVFP